MNHCWRFIILLQILVACQSTQQEDKSFFSYNLHTPVSSLDPSQARNLSNTWATNHLFDGLVSLDDNLKVIPAIAKSWSISPDGKQYTFILKDNISFHENKCFNDQKRFVKASDFVFSFNRILDPTTGSTGAWIFKDRVVSENPFLAPNDSTFVIQLNQPFLPLLGILTMKYASVVPHEAITMYGSAFGEHPVGTGPFKLFKWEKDQVILLTKNENYYQKDANGQSLPYLKRVKITQIQDKKTAYLEFIQGKLDMITGVESSYVNELLDSTGNILPKWENKIYFDKSAFLNTEYIGINQNLAKGTPYENPIVIKALNHALDRSLMIKKLRNSVGSPANEGFIPHRLSIHDKKTVKGFDYDQNIAQSLLKESGYPNGNGLPPLVIDVNKDHADIISYVAKQWNNIGIKTSLNLMDGASLREKISSGKSMMFKASWIADYPDGESFMTCFYSKNGAPPNYTAFQNNAFDLVYEQCLKEQTEPYKTENYIQMGRILNDNPPFVLLFYDQSARFFKDNVKGISSNAMNLLNLTTTRKE